MRPQRCGSHHSATPSAGGRPLKAILIIAGVGSSGTLAFAPHPYLSTITVGLRTGTNVKSRLPELWSSTNNPDKSSDLTDTTQVPTTSPFLGPQFSPSTKKEEEETYQIAFRNTILSIAVSILFGACLWFTAGPQVGEEFFAGYIVEKSLSVDNLFVFLLLFDFFQVPSQYQNRILSWGIYGSVVMRAIMIGVGATALQHFRGILLVFAGILIYSAVQVLVDVEDELVEKRHDLHANPVVQFSRYLCESNDSCDIEDFDDEELENPVVMVSRSLFPSTKTYDGDRFFTMEDGIKKATPLFACMVAVELSDVVFAVDSIPAVFGVTEVSVDIV